ncbi:MAG TPA: hypothetical protein VNO70_20850 [Blastocatellia bacterium]|nr:hypothetical protein [Blastocatellia bacterium]
MRIPLSIVTALSLLALSACREFALDERFYDDRLLNWTAVDDPETVEGPSKWVVEKDGWLHERSNIWGRRGDFLGRWYGTYLVAGDADWKDYHLQVRAKPGDDDGFGVVFRFADPEHFYRLIFIQDGFNGGPLTRLDKREGADYTELWSTKKGFRTGTEMFIEVEVTGDVIKAAVDGRPLVEIRDSSYRDGKIGLFSYAQSDQAFDDVKVRLK